ncbi:hypothetical protein AJ87_23825 [Rhizobium yanglingense]|nr:hypothetical protein AJ87_23825 [Rhizobium yanglingense]
MSYKLRFLVEADKEIPLAKLPEFTMIATAAIGHADGGLLRVPVIDLAHPKPPIDALHWTMTSMAISISRLYQKRRRTRLAQDGI